MFAEYVLKIESDSVTAIEVVHHVKELQMTLTNNAEDDFLSPNTLTEMEKLLEKGFADSYFKAVCKEFSGIYFFRSETFNVSIYVDTFF